MNGLLIKYQKISKRIDAEKEKESDRLIPALAEMLLSDEEEQEEY